jgi:hypothetical protein
MTSVGRAVGAKARQLIDEASFGPEALRAIGAAFDAAWAVSNNFGDDSADVEKACLRLANALRSITSEVAVSVGIIERTRINLVDNGLFPPSLIFDAFAHQLSASNEARVFAVACFDRHGLALNPNALHLNCL